MKKYIIKLLFIVSIFGFFSCEEYLDQAPESSLTIEDVFKDFQNAQGFVEEMHALVVDYPTYNHTFADFLYGDDGYVPASFKFSRQIDMGQLNAWSNFKYSYLNNVKDYGTKDNNVTNTEGRKRPGLWQASWMGIRKANIVIENIDLMVNATQGEKDAILGQAYFFRAFFHNEIMKYWGRIPYIDKVLTDDYKLPRPATYKEVALKANEDYIKAAELLPVDWDEETYGQLTLSLNMNRVTKGAAYSFQGKNLLLAASPLMHFNNAAGIDTYVYDTELANEATKAFAKVFELVDQGRYALMPFDRIDEVFWKTPTNKGLPGGTEFIFNGQGGHQGQTSRKLMEEGVDWDFTGGSKHCTSPTHNFIYYNFGMANGLSIEDDMSGAYGAQTYDPSNPFEGRDPRFKKAVMCDGDVIGTKASIPADHKNAQLYTGGAHRDDNGSKTGYFFIKFWPTEYTKWNRGPMTQSFAMRLHMRLTDVYLMYAEALHAAKGSGTVAGDTYSFTAEDAINKLRKRPGLDMPNVHPSIVVDYNKFMDEIRRERTVELAFEAHRWLDLRRWGIAHLEKYRVKTALDFPKDYSYFNVKEIITRVCDYPKHYWLPFAASQTQIYEGFEQNPGW